MFFSHLSFAIRFFQKEGSYTVLNLMGLILGIGIGIILLLYLQNELNYDTHHTRGDQVYRISQLMNTKSGEYNTARTPRELAPLLKKDIPEVQSYVRFNLYEKTMVTVNSNNGQESKFYEERIMETDSSFFSLFSHDIIEGNPENCLSGPGKAILTRSIAKKYFNDQSAVGKVITLASGDQRTISAVISDLPDNSHLKYEILLSKISERKRFAETEDQIRKSEGFWNPRCYTYVLMPKEYDPSNWNDRFQLIFNDYYTAFGKKIEGTASSSLTPLYGIHYNSNLQDDEVQGDLGYLYTFATIGLLVILLVSINYTNMATARSVVRTKEMGIRKALGSSRSQLFTSVLSEALILSTLAMVFAVILVFLVLEVSPFNVWINKDLSLNFLSNPQLLAGVILITVTIGTVSGIYPAVYIPAIKVTSALKGSVQTSQIEAFLRKGLIVLQFSVSVFVILLVVLMDRQTNYLNSADIGFNQDNLVIIPLKDASVSNKMEAIRNELATNPGIISVTTARTTPGINVHSPAFRVERDGEMVIKGLGTIVTGDKYLETMGMEIVKGRDFRPEDAIRESMGVIINETAVRELGWKANPLNKRVRFFHGKVDMHVIGVVKDFNFQSLHNTIGPLIILRTKDSGSIHVRVSNKNLDKTLAYLEDQFEVFDPAHPFEYSFVDKEFEKQYQAEQIQLQLISSLSIICIIVSVLGLIGLSAFNIDQKAKEISIRKVLGASTESILIKFSKDYTLLIAVAIILAIPIASFMIREWLAEFAYQVEIKWFFYAIPGILVLVLGLTIVVLQSIKSAQANPVRSLRQA